MAEPTEIAIAVVEHDGKFLIGERPEGTPLAGYWEFPGGKVEPGEDPRATAARECLEETGLQVTIGEEYPEVVHQYDHDKLRLHFFKAELSEFALPTNPRFQWVLRKQLVDFSFPEANQGLLQSLCEEAPPSRDIKFWLGPGHALLILVFAGLLLNYERYDGAGVSIVIAALGFLLLGMSNFRYTLHKGQQFTLQQVFFDATALCVTCVFAKVIGWIAFLVWIPLLLLRRL
jgi:8-oxo-dGTP diphosphatase